MYFKKSQYPEFEEFQCANLEERIFLLTKDLIRVTDLKYSDFFDSYDTPIKPEDHIYKMTNVWISTINFTSVLEYSLITCGFCEPTDYADPHKYCNSKYLREKVYVKTRDPHTAVTVLCKSNLCPDPRLLTSFRFEKSADAVYFIHDRPKKSMIDFIKCNVKKYISDEVALDVNQVGAAYINRGLGIPESASTPESVFDEVTTDTSNYYKRKYNMLVEKIKFYIREFQNFTKKHKVKEVRDASFMKCSQLEHDLWIKKTQIKRDLLYLCELLP